MMASGQLVFKKAFGIDSMPSDAAIWLIELKDATFQIQLDGLTFTVEVGQVGGNEKEKFAIGLFKHSDERDPHFIAQILSLNVSACIKLEIPRDLDDRVVGSADEFVKPFIHPAFVALQHFIESYRDVKYITLRETTRWTEEWGVIVQEISLRNFKTYLFYSLTLGDRVFVGSFSEGRAMMATPGDLTIRQLVTTSLSEGVPLARVLIVRAWEHFFGGDFRSAIVEATTVIELSLADICRKGLSDAHIASGNRVNRFIEETSKRLLATVVGGLLGIESEEWREGVAATLDIRHALVHGKKRYASYIEAQSAVKNAERLLILAEHSTKGECGA